MQSSALLLGSSARVIVAIARCLSRHGVEVHVASLLPTQPVIRSRAITSFQFLPSEPKAFADCLIEILHDRTIDLIYPCGDEALICLAQSEDRIRPLVTVACPVETVVQRVLDKSVTLSTAQVLGIPVPKAYVFDNIEMFYEHSSEILFPVIAKPRRKDLETPLRIRYYHTASALEAEFAQDPEFGKHVLIQEYLPGGGVGIEILMHKGEPLVIFQHRRLTELPITGGVSVRAHSEPVDPILAKYAIQLLHALSWEGVAMVEFRQDRMSGRLALMEVNGRYWGSLPLSFAAGIEFPWYEWQIAHSQDPHPPHTYPPASIRWFAGELARLPQVASEVVQGRLSVGSGLNQVVAVPLGFMQLKDAIWRFDDQKPAWDDLRHTWSTIFKPLGIRLLSHLVPAFGRRVASLARFGSMNASVIYRRLVDGCVVHPRAPEHLNANSVLILCHGNIIRSPFLEHALAKMLAKSGVLVSSAGLSCIPGRPADDRAISAGRTFGIDLSRHRATFASKDLIENADAILVMDYRNLAMLLDRSPEVSVKSYLVADWIEDRLGSREVSDPFSESAGKVAECYVLLMEAARRIANCAGSNLGQCQIEGP